MQNRRRNFVWLRERNNNFHFLADGYSALVFQLYDLFATSMLHKHHLTTQSFIRVTVKRTVRRLLGGIAVVEVVVGQ